MSKHMNKMTIAALALAVAMTPVSAFAKDAPAAIVNGTEISRTEVSNALKAMNVPATETDRAFPIITDQLINEKLVDGEIAKANLEKDPTFIARKAAAEAQLVKTFFLEKLLKDKVSDAAVKAEYNKIKKDNSGKQEAHARHIVLATEDEAKQVIKDLDSGAKFDVLAKERSSGPTAKAGGDVGWFAAGEIIPEFSDAAFKLKPGTYTKAPVKTNFGWHVIFLDEKRSRKVPEYKEAEMQIRNKLSQDAIETYVKDLRAKADIKRFGADGKPLEAAPVKN